MDISKIKVPTVIFIMGVLVLIFAFFNFVHTMSVNDYSLDTVPSRYVIEGFIATMVGGGLIVFSDILKHKKS